MRYRSVVVVVLLIIIALVYRYGYLISGGVAGGLETRARERVLQPFRLTDIAAFPWDRVVFLEPYDNQAVADRALGFHWPDFRLFGLESSDGFSLVVFANVENVVRAEKVGRCRPDFAKELVGKAVIRVNATFAIEDTGDCRVLKLVNELPATGR
jgi:hypothetical protein